MNRIEDIVYYDFQGWPEYKIAPARQADSHMSMEKLAAFIEALEKKGAGSQ